MSREDDRDRFNHPISIVEMDRIVSGKRGWVKCVKLIYKICDRKSYTQASHPLSKALQIVIVEADCSGGKLELSEVSGV
ncbi:hypothetical protein [Limnofasciculus baicalensis]|uniref:Uncharacterized protein n=1 Tax=Limnofasciculus baicalensis BBK-W-15 TaxID=2699891 RepID=A0AAE3GM43_9CYAN|nr:hypothetical protein [Limnofasciculus baicalensis]MCP2727100.1 hypothetical protein [Limnofasciculus baicalensis BBK-W-15]